MSEEFTTIASVNFNQSYNNMTETATATSALPDHFENQAKELVKLIEAYYRYLNSKGGPSYELANLNNNHDIDLVEDNRYLNAIEKTIAINIPQSRALDRKRLFKIIANYYTNRGSEESIYSFFRIFFNEIVDISYPKTRLFNTSDVKSKSSDVYRLRDDKRWQDYSYIISSELDLSEWKYEYLKYIHPSGLKFFSALVLVLFRDNNWYTPEHLSLIETNNYNIVNEKWKYINWEEFIGYHSPLFQTDINIDPNIIIRIINNANQHYKTNINNIKGVQRDDLMAFWLYFLSKFVLTNSNTRHSAWRNSWRVYEKYTDKAPISEYVDCIINDVEFGSNNFGSGPQFNTYNSSNIINNFEDSGFEENPTSDIIWDTLFNSYGGGLASRDGYNLATAYSYLNSFVSEIVSNQLIYLNPEGTEGYYFTPNDYYTQPQLI